MENGEWRISRVVEWMIVMIGCQMTSNEQPVTRSSKLKVESNKKLKAQS